MPSSGSLSAPPPGFVRRDERPHAGMLVDEWVFAFWLPDGSLGGVSGHRQMGRSLWYWAALARRGRPLLHVTEWDITTRADPMIIKAHGLWAEHRCEAPFEQWSVGNETYAVALDAPDDALGKAYGAPTPIAFDVEWYATEPAAAIPGGYQQAGVAHGVIDIETGEDNVGPVAPIERIELDEAPARRWRRWGDQLGPLPLDTALAHTGLRAPFAFPDGTVLDLALLPDGWRALPGRQ